MGVVTALLVTSAATLFESAPFILAAAVLTHLPLRWNARIAAYLGCGCGVGPSARSLPAAAATALVFGPLVAGARLAAAIAVERFSRPRHQCSQREVAFLSELQLVAPVAVLGGCAALFVPVIGGLHSTPLGAFAAGAVAAFTMAPCALGGVAFAATLRTLTPAASAG